MMVHHYWHHNLSLKNFLHAILQYVGSIDLAPSHPATDVSPTPISAQNNNKTSIAPTQNPLPHPTTAQGGMVDVTD
eukprot:6979074-Ditylum_brightwellii.AAC.1